MLALAQMPLVVNFSNPTSPNNSPAANINFSYVTAALPVVGGSRRRSAGPAFSAGAGPALRAGRLVSRRGGLVGFCVTGIAIGIHSLLRRLSLGLSGLTWISIFFSF